MYIYIHICMYVCMYNIFPPFKNTLNKKKCYKCCVVFICNYKIKYVIYETYNIIFRILKFYTKYYDYLNVIIFIKFYCE
jgi:hypothetical protein